MVVGSFGCPLVGFEIQEDHGVRAGQNDTVFVCVEVMRIKDDPEFWDPMLMEANCIKATPSYDRHVSWDPMSLEADLQAAKPCCASRSMVVPRVSLGSRAPEVNVGIPDLTTSEVAADPGHRVLDVQREIEDRVCLPLQAPVLQGRPTLRVPGAKPSVDSPRRSVRLAAKPRAPNPTLHAQVVLMTKWGVLTPSKPVGSAKTHKLDSIFAKPLSESKHEAFKVLFQDDAFLDDSELDRLLP
jgi:hypothetical protein